MSVRSGGGSQFSFELLAGDSSGDERSLSLLQIPGAIYENGGRDGHSTRRKRKSKAAKKKKSRAALVSAEEPSLLPELDVEKATSAGNWPEIAVSECTSVVESVAPELERIWELNGSELASEEPRIESDLDARNLSLAENGSYGIGMGFVTSENRSVTESVCENTVVMPEFDSLEVSCISHVELRQRNVNGDIPDKPAEEGSSTRESSTGQWIAESNGHLAKMETVESVDWNRVLAEDPNLLGEVSSLESSPFKYFMGEIYGGSSLRSTISVGNDKKRQRVYNTMFHVPLRCERLILAGFFVCLDSFLSLLTIMPARILMAIWRVLNTRQFQRPNAAELSDFGCFVVLAFGVASLQSTDISLIYHIIRGQGTLKLYVVYNVLEIFDKLCQSFGEDVLQVLLNSAEGLANSSADNVAFELIRFIFDQIIAVVAFIVHSFILLAQAVTLSTCIIAHNNALLALLVSNNFSEIKSNVFKRVSKENLHNLVYYDIVERFHITAFVLFVLAQNILEAEGPWFGSFLTNALLVYMCEVFIDMIKHSFLAKFNEIKPVAYSDFLEDLCKQTLNDKSEERRQDLTFIPLAPACVVIRVLTPIYGTLLPYGPLPWRLFWILLWSTLTYFMLAIWKIMVGLSLRRLASWYINQRLRRKQHMD